MQDTIIGEEDEVFKKFWNAKTPPPAQHFTWRVVMNRNATKDNKSNKGINDK